jgi:hypothetical protein
MLDRGVVSCRTRPSSWPTQRVHYLYLVNCEREDHEHDEQVQIWVSAAEVDHYNLHLQFFLPVTFVMNQNGCCLLSHNPQPEL